MYQDGFERARFVAPPSEKESNKMMEKKLETKFTDWNL